MKSKDQQLLEEAYNQIANSTKPLNEGQSAECRLTFTFSRKVSEEQMRNKVARIFKAFGAQVSDVDSRFDEDGYYIAASGYIGDSKVSNVAQLKEIFRQLERESKGTLNFSELTINGKHVDLFSKRVRKADAAAEQAEVERLAKKLGIPLANVRGDDKRLMMPGWKY